MTPAKLREMAKALDFESPDKSITDTLRWAANEIEWLENRKIKSSKNF